MANNNNHKDLYKPSEIYTLSETIHACYEQADLLLKYLTYKYLEEDFTTLAELSPTT
jgi:hypothetical protein